MMRKILLPFSWVYGSVMLVRNWMFDHGILRERQFDIPVIGVGNLAVGGTGKTPHVEKILRILEGRRVAVVSRGYGRKTHGFRYVNGDCAAEEVGDEPLQMKRKFPDVTFAVDESRVEAIEILMQSECKPEFVILDDAFQHRYVKPWMQIMLTDYGRMFTRDYVMPAGCLREFRRGCRRADLIIVTKCPQSLTEDEARRIKDEINPQDRQKVMFTAIDYSVPAEQFKDKYVVLLTGIARPEPLFEYISATAAKVEHMRFADHHTYTQNEVAAICDAARKADVLLTTEKDAARLSDTDVYKDDAVKSKLLVMPIEVRILFRNKH